MHEGLHRSEIITSANGGHVLDRVGLFVCFIYSLNGLIFKLYNIVVK